MSDNRIRLFCPSVARPDFGANADGWILMNRADKGYGEQGYPFPALEDAAKMFAVVFGAVERDRHSVFVRVELAPEYTPGPHEIEAARQRKWNADAGDDAIERHAAQANLAAWQLLAGLRAGTLTQPAPTLRLARNVRRSP